MKVYGDEQAGLSSRNESVRLWMSSGNTFLRAIDGARLLRDDSDYIL